MRAEISGDARKGAWALGRRLVAASVAGVLAYGVYDLETNQKPDTPQTPVPGIEIQHTMSPNPSAVIPSEIPRR